MHPAVLLTVLPSDYCLLFRLYRRLHHTSRSIAMKLKAQACSHHSLLYCSLHCLLYCLLYCRLHHTSRSIAVKLKAHMLNARALAAAVKGQLARLPAMHEWQMSWGDTPMQAPVTGQIR
jgi:hypothetical protein